jgi:hypothetical protein
MHFSYRLCAILPANVQVCESKTLRNSSGLPDGFLAIDVDKKVVVWFSKSCSKVIRTFTSNGYVGIAREPNLGFSISATFCSLKKVIYVAILTSPTSLSVHQILGAEYFELPLIQAARLVRDKGISLP